jgi:hypothetical protein
VVVRQKHKATLTRVLWMTGYPEVTVVIRRGC